MILEQEIGRLRISLSLDDLPSLPESRLANIGATHPESFKFSDFQRTVGRRDDFSSFPRPSEKDFCTLRYRNSRVFHE